MQYYVSLLLALLTFPLASYAQRVGLTLGLSQVQVDGTSGTDVSSGTSYQLGGLFYQPMAEQIEVRLGALYAQETLTASSGGVDTTIHLSQLNVPLTAGYKVGERFLLFAGPVLSINVGKSCDVSTNVNCSINNLKVKGTDILLSLGANFQLTEELGMELSLDRMSSKPFEGSSGGQIINVNFQYIIE